MTAIAENPSSASLSALLNISGMSVGYGKTTVLRDIDLRVDAGAVVAVLGANGAGKSTLMRTIAGELLPHRGAMDFNGENLVRLSPERRARAGVAHIPEGRGVFRSLSVKENLALFSKHGDDPGAIDEVLKAFPVLSERLSQRAGSLSGGEQQMLAIASAYCRNVKLVLVDEPSLGLAPIITSQVFDFLAQMPARGASLVIVDQFVDKVLQIATYVYIMRRGSIVFAGPPTELGDDVFAYYTGQDSSEQG